jgi:hypothetical protein
LADAGCDPARARAQGAVTYREQGRVDGNQYSARGGTHRTVPAMLIDLMFV